MALTWDSINSSMYSNIAANIVDTVFTSSPLMSRLRTTSGSAGGYQSANYMGIQVVSDPYMPEDTITLTTSNTTGGGSWKYLSTSDQTYVWEPVIGTSKVEITGNPKRQKRKRSAKVQPISFERVFELED